MLAQSATIRTALISYQRVAGIGRLPTIRPTAQDAGFDDELRRNLRSLDRVELSTEARRRYEQELAQNTD
jgi:hypothetical protein